MNDQNRVSLNNRKQVSSHSMIMYSIVVLLFIYISDDTLLFGTNSNVTFVTIKYIYIMTMTCLMSLIILCRTHRIPQNEFLWIFIMAGIVFLSMIINNDVRMGYLYKIILLGYSLCIIKLMGVKLFAYIFNKVMLILATISIIGFIIICIMPAIFSKVPIVVNSADNTFYNLVIFSSPTSFYSGFIRNYGIFREPGVYQMYLMLGLIFQHFFLKEKKIFPYIIYIVAIVSTMSTTGYIALGIFLVLVTFTNSGLSKRQKTALIVFITLGLVYLVINTSIFSLSMDNQYNSVFAKLMNKNRSTTIARFASITENIRIMGIDPIFGVGLKNLEEMFPLYTWEHYGFGSTHNTNTIFAQFAAHGAIYGLLLIVLCYKFARTISNKYAVWIFAIILVLFFGENLTFSGLMSICLMIGLTTENR